MSKTVTMSDNARIVEVILYVENEAISATKIAELSGLSESEVKAALKETSIFSLHVLIYMTGLKRAMEGKLIGD